MKLALTLALGTILAATLAASPVHARPRTATCRIVTQGEKPYLGPCRFLPDGKGSFAVEPIGRRFFFPSVSTISLTVTGPGQAEVSGLTAAGINSRWGEAKRSKSAPACWRGGDFRICVT